MKMKPDEKIKFLQELPNGHLIVFTPETPSNKIIMMCPGGGLSHINVGHEGYDAATWFNERGFTFAILKYRFPNEIADGPLQDTAKALSLIERNYPERPLKGIMGASVGGYLAAYTATVNKVDFQILMYPVLSMRDEYTHIPTREKIFGKELTEEEKSNKSMEMQVNDNTPPTFLVAAANDPIVPPQSSCLYGEKLLVQHKSLSLHIYPEGGHSFGFNAFAFKKSWLDELNTWLSLWP